MQPFHYAFKVKDLASTRRFYVELMAARRVDPLRPGLISISLVTSYLPTSVLSGRRWIFADWWMG
jgi:catechol 2,3-dioxygenase-like lactoylglutathione lyase family enzyme